MILVSSRDFVHMYIGFREMTSSTTTQKRSPRPFSGFKGPPCQISLELVQRFSRKSITDRQVDRVTSEFIKFVYL